MTIRDGSGVRTIKLATLLKAGGVRTIYQTLAVTVSPASAFGSAGSYGPTTVTTSFVTATVSGAVGDISYLWTNSNPDWSAINPTGSITNFSKSEVPPGTTQSTTFTVTVHDTAGGSASATVGASARCVDIR